ncbi:Trimethylguanosine synthase [Clonorchis sinensis]|uniref:Trimethylguanosine synthase n=1 Tax=Clonorchis sinensis TaxID=79923 RepID=A0A419PQS4_CLOSI|nr:Trimethylguanosine synthase [Clonorchis sinensis]
MPNREVRRMVVGRNNSPTIDELITLHRLRWLGYVLRMPVDRLPRRALSHNHAISGNEPGEVKQCAGHCRLPGGGPRDGPHQIGPKWLEREFTDHKVRGSNRTSVSRLPPYLRLNNVAVSQYSCFSRLAWQLGTERVLQLSSFFSIHHAWKGYTLNQHCAPAINRVSHYDVFSSHHLFIGALGRQHSLHQSTLRLDAWDSSQHGFFSATPEVIAAHQARRVYRALVSDPSAVHRRTVIDACSGAGVNSIQLALLGFHVISVEIDPARIAMSMHNAQIYGVQSRIEFVCADFFTWARHKLNETKRTRDTPRYDAVILSPPWGGPTYLEQSVFDLDSIRFGRSPSYDIWLATELASQLSLGNVVIFLPRNTNMTQLPALSAPLRSARLSWSSCKHFATQWCPDEMELEVEVNLINSKIKALTVYSGDLCISHRSTDRPTWSTGEVAFGHDENNNNNHLHVDSDPSSSSCSSSSGFYLSASEGNF